MTDKELLELAAKAAGIDGKYTDAFGGDYYDCRNLSQGIETKDGELWNPLDFSDDALNLAVDLSIYIHPEFMENEVMTVIRGGRRFHETHGKDKRAATRRAIVIAAAAIGAKP